MDCFARRAPRAYIDRHKVGIYNKYHYNNRRFTRTTALQLCNRIKIWSNLIMYNLPRSTTEYRGTLHSCYTAIAHVIITTKTTAFTKSKLQGRIWGDLSPSHLPHNLIPLTQY